MLPTQERRGVMRTTIIVLGSIFMLMLPTNQTAHANQQEVQSSNIIQHINDHRSQSELEPLVYDQSLQTAATAKAAHMQSEQYWAHNSPDGDSPWQFIEAEGYNYTQAGENLAIGFSDEENMVSAWIDSPDHARVLRGEYQHVGFGIQEASIGDRSGILVVAMFGEPKPQPNQLLQESLRIVFNTFQSLSLSPTVPAATIGLSIR